MKKKMRQTEEELGKRQQRVDRDLRCQFNFGSRKGKIERDCCEFICTVPKTLQDYGIDVGKIGYEV